MTARTRPASQTLIEVEAKLLNDSTSGERCQVGLPIVGRAAESRVCYRLYWLDVLDGDAFEGMETNEPAGRLLGIPPAPHRQRSARCRQDLEGTALRAANPAYEQAQNRDEVGLLLLTFAQSPEPGTSPAPETPPPGLDSGQVVERPPPEDAPAGRLGHWQRQAPLDGRGGPGEAGPK